MKHSHSGNGRDARTTELSQLLARGRVDVDETVHVADDEFVHACRGGGLPLGSETVLDLVVNWVKCIEKWRRRPTS